MVSDLSLSLSGFSSLGCCMALPRSFGMVLPSPHLDQPTILYRNLWIRLKYVQSRWTKRLYFFPSRKTQGGSDPVMRLGTTSTQEGSFAGLVHQHQTQQLLGKWLGSKLCTWPPLRGGQKCLLHCLQIGKLYWYKRKVAQQRAPKLLNNRWFEPPCPAQLLLTLLSV